MKNPSLWEWETDTLAHLDPFPVPQPSLGEANVTLFL